MKNELSEFHISKLVEIIKANLEHYSMQANVYGCLKAIIEKRVLTPDIYDLIEIIGDKMITNVNKGVRSTCAKIYVQFLIEYPLEEKRVEQHVYHLIKNINYFDKDGRLSVLDVIERVVSRFPTEILDKYAFILFLSLILRTVNEKMSNLKEKANNILKDLLINVSDSKRDDIIKTVLTWDYNVKQHIDSALGDLSSQCHESMLKRVTFLLIGLIISIDSDKFATKYFDKTIELLNSELEMQSSKIEAILTQFAPESDPTEISKLEIVKKQMGDFFTEIDSMVADRTTISSDLSTCLNKQELVTALTALNILSKFVTVPHLFEKLYKTQLVHPSDLIENILKFAKMSSMLVPSTDPTFTSLRNVAYSIISTIFSNLDSMSVCKGYEKEENVCKVLDDLSILIVKFFTFDDTVVNMSMFIILHLVKRNDSLEKLSKVFNMASYAGRRIMMNLKRDSSQLVAILRVFIMSIQQVFTDVKVLKDMAKPMLHLAYKVYINPQLKESETKVIAAELIETLQNKLDEYDSLYESKQEDENEDKNITNSTFIQMYNDIKNSSEKTKMLSKEKRKINRLNDLQRHKRKRSTKRKNKRQADKKEREKYI